MMENQKNTEASFEEDLNRLEEIVSKLEDGGLSLDSSLELFEKGQVLLDKCRKKLDKAQVTVKKLLENGNTEEMDPNQAGR